MDNFYYSQAKSINFFFFCVIDSWDYFIHLMGSKIQKRAENNYLLFLVYFRYFSGFIYKQIRVFS
jgi:hypothetical protein